MDDVAAHGGQSGRQARMHTYVAYVCFGVKGHTGLADYGYAAYDCATTPRAGADACRGREELCDRPG